MRLVAALLVIATLSCSTVSAGFRGHANLYQLSQRVHEWEQQQSSQHLLKSEPRWEYVETNRFTQPLDHFNEQDTRTWQQRYYINTEFEVVGGPIFVYIGGESEVSNRSVVGGEIYANAKLHNATIMSVEHRYYGESVPQLFTNLDTENLNWLTSQQALADLANIITSLMSSRAGWAGRKVFTWGGSYPGALSAWFRLKYPHLTVGSVASSAPVLAKPDFYEYDESVATAIGNTCANKIQQATTAIEALLKINSTETKERFGCNDIENDVSFLYVLADAVAYAVQYSKTINGTAYDGLCEIMETPGDLVENYVTFLKNLLHKKRTTCLDFSTSEEILSNTTIDPQNAGRQWYYQSCNEFGYFQTAPIAPRFSLRSRLINVSYHEKLCATVFGRMIKPHTDFTNAYYGGDKTAGSNIIFVNGNIDPWHKLSIIAPLTPYPTEIPVYINGTSHCADLSSASDNDPPSLTTARATIRDIISTWLAEERVQACPTYMTVCNGRCVDTENDPHHCGSCGNDITTQSDRYCANGMSQDSSPRSEIGRELIIIGGVCTLIGIVALIVAVRALRRAKQMNESHGLSHEYNAMRA